MNDQNNQFRNSPDLSVFLNVAQENEGLVAEHNPELVELLARLNQSFMKMLGGQFDEGDVQTFLVLSAHAYFLASVRTALSGQATAVYPLVRAAIESVLFGLIMVKKPSSVSIWAQRDESPTKGRKCRDLFTATKGFVELKVDNADLHDELFHRYKQCITFGAHPNAGAVLPHLRMEETSTHVIATFRCIHAADSNEVRDTLEFVTASGCCTMAAMSYVLINHLPAKTAFNEAYEILEELRRLIRTTRR